MFEYIDYYIFSDSLPTPTSLQRFFNNLLNFSIFSVSETSNGVSIEQEKDFKISSSPEPTFLFKDFFLFEI